MSADPQKLLADFKAGKLVNPLEFLVHGLRAVEADRARPGARRKTVAASASPDGVVRGPLLKGLVDGLRALEAASKRADSRRIPEQTRDKDCRQVVAALYRLETEFGHKPKLPYARLVKLLAEHLEISGKRVREALRQVRLVRPALFSPSGPYREGAIFSCEGCAVPDDVCLLHGSAEAMFNAALPQLPFGSSKAVMREGLPEYPHGTARGAGAYAAYMASGDGWDEQKECESATEYRTSLPFKPRKRVGRTAQGFAPRWTSAGKVGFGPLKLHTT